MKKKEKSVTYFEKALDYFCELFPDGHDCIKATQGNIQVVKSELQSNEDIVNTQELSSDHENIRKNKKKQKQENKCSVS